LASVHSWIFPEIQPVPEFTFEGGFRRAFTIQGNPIGLTLLQQNPGKPIQILYKSDEVTKNDVLSKVRQTLNLDFNMKPVLDTMKAEPSLQDIATKIKGIRPYVADTPFEALIKSILQQQISYQAANVITKRMVLKLGMTIQENEPIYTFPSTEEILSAGAKGLKEFGVGYKIDYILNLCNLVVSKEVDIDGMIGRPYDDVFAILQPIKGIGEWTIQALAIAGLSDYSVFPFGDLAVQKILGKLIADGRRLTKKEVIRFAESTEEVGPQILYFLMCADALGQIDNKPQREIHKRRKHPKTLDT
ncbi:MAG: hypothetical protein P1Q69_17785, partial [Candidatus Thorarchaeota archaeon]|nr:hypothetical protein [Candidatus Thorarchaeota archaeon]